MATAKKYSEYQDCTIGPDLFEAWKSMNRKGDGLAISKELGFSRPVICRALLYGNVTKPGLADMISDWFIKRAEKEKEQESKMTQLKYELNFLKAHDDKGTSV